MPKNKVIVRKKSRHQLEAQGDVAEAQRGKKKVELQERRVKQLKALELRQSGATYQMICDALQLSSPSHAKKYVDRALDRLEIEAAKDVVRMDLSRLDEFQMRCTHALRQNGDLHQIDRILRIMEFRYRLLGVNDETVRQLQADHGIGTTTNIKNVLMNVTAAPETQEEFVGKMMRAVGVDPDSEEAKRFLSEHSRTGNNPELPMAPGSANDTGFVEGEVTEINEEAIIDAEIVEEL